MCEAEGTIAQWSATPADLSAHTHWLAAFFLSPGWAQVLPRPQAYLFLRSVQCWPWSSSLDRQRQRPWAGSPEVVSSTCVVSGLLLGSIPLPCAAREGQE